MSPCARNTQKPVSIYTMRVYYDIESVFPYWYRRTRSGSGSSDEKQPKRKWGLRVFRDLYFGKHGCDALESFPLSPDFHGDERPANPLSNLAGGYPKRRRDFGPRLNFNILWIRQLLSCQHPPPRHPLRPTASPSASASPISIFFRHGHAQPLAQWLPPRQP